MQPSSESERFVETSGGAHISYEDRGHGEPALLLLPGWASSRRVFAPVVSQLAASRRVLSWDMRGHGRSSRDVGDFGLAQVTDDAVAVIEASGARHVIPVALSHAGWLALELRKRLGDRIPMLVLLDWIILDPPPPFLDALAALQANESWREVRDRLFSMWLADTDNEQLSAFLSSDMGEYTFETWARAGREIASSYRADGNPLKALAALQSPVPVLHIYAQPDDPAYLDAQQAFAAEHPWFHVVKLHARTHFPMFETPSAVTDAINAFVGQTLDR